MADTRVASRYVKSLLGLAVEQGVLNEVHADMQLFDQVCRANRDFVLMLNSPIVRHEKKKEIPEIKLLDLSRNFGHHYAIQAGLQYATGDLIFLVVI